MSKVRDLHHRMRHLLQNTAECLRKGKLTLRVPTHCILVNADFKLGLFSLCSMAGLLALEANPFTDFHDL